MTSNLTVGYMAEQINRGRLDGVATRGWLADEAAAAHTPPTVRAQVTAILATARARLNGQIPGRVRPTGASIDAVALPTR